MGAVHQSRIPDDRIIIPGVIDAASNFVEHPRLVAQRIERYVNLLGRDRVIAGPDRGFGTLAGFGLVPSEVAWKLTSLTDGAHIASA